MKKFLSVFIFSLLLAPLPAIAEKEVKVGMGAVLSGDLAVFGKGDAQAAQTYLKHYGRHPIKLIVEDAILTSSEGLRAYQKLINLDKVDLLLAAGSSNGIMAAKGLVNTSKTVTFMVSTGGDNIDKAGPYIFRTGNSDTLNGLQQAEYFLDKGIKRVALLTELTEYTTDISRFFRDKFLEGGGELVYDESFLPQTTDFRTQATTIIAKKPQAVFMPTQTGTALGIFVKQLRLQEKGDPIEVHTTMVAAPNPDAHEIAGRHILGVFYMDPDYDPGGEKYQKFIKLYRQDHGGEEPAAPFHAASVVDALEHLQNFLDKYGSYDKEKFRTYILEEVGEYCGMMGCYSFDKEGNTDLGFHIAKIERQVIKDS